VKLSERFLLADVRLDWDLDRSGTSGWVSRAGLVGAMPMPDATGADSLWRIIAYDPSQPGDTPTEQQILERLERILPERTGRDVHVTGADWLSMFSVHRRLADTYRQGRVLIAGDAAHTHAPFGGQGMLTALGDVENLAWKLALVVGGCADQALLDTYEAERRPLATTVLRSTSAVTKVDIAHSRPGRFVRDRLLTPLFNLSSVQRWVTYKTSQLWVSYRRGPLAEKSLFGREPRPGDRIPDLQCQRLDGESTRLYAELRGRWALLGPETDITLLATAQAHLGDRVTALRRADSAEGDAFLIRPDGHLAWRGHDESLARWLGRALGTGRVR
jgi:4,5-epoxidase